MSITPVASTALESLSSDPGNDAPASGFDLLLASAEANPETARSDNPRSDKARDSHAHDGTDPASGRASAKTATDKTTTDKSGPDKNAETNDDNTAMLAPLAPAVTPPTPAPAPAGNSAAADTPQVPTPTQPVIITPTAQDLVDPTATDPAPATDPTAVDLQTVVEAALDDAGPATSVAATPTPPRVGNPNDKNAPGPPEHANAVFNRTSDDTNPPHEATPTPPANANAIANASANSALANAPAATTDHIRVPPENTPARPEGPSTSALDATSPTPPASAPTASTTVVETVTTTPAAAPPPPAEQLVSVLKPMRETPNGSYTLHLELKPPELGRIELRVEMRDGVMHASIHSDREGSAQMLRDALSELRDRLDAASVRTGSLTVSDGSVGARDHDGANANGQSGANGRDDVANANDLPTALNTAGTDLESEATSLLDVRV